MTLLMMKGLGCIAVISGVAFVVSAFRTRRSAKQESKWEAAEGVISCSSVHWNGQLYVPAVKYTYEIGGGRFERSEVRTGLVCYNWRGPAERICEKYAAGVRVRVYVDRDDHSRAVLEPGGDSKHLPLLAAIGLFLCVVGLALVVS